MLCKLKSFVAVIGTKKVILRILDISLILFICCAYFILKARQSEAPSQRWQRYIKFDEDYKVQCSLTAEELMWRLGRRLVEADVGVLNAAKFSADEQGAALVVLAGRRPARLQRLLASLAEVRDIGGALLLISHSFYDEAINDLVRGVDYCRVQQIFYPYSLQLFPDGFPGPAVDRSRRYATGAERKHHWWWTAHFLFDHYPWIAPKFSGMALFLQEDDYVAPDLLHMLRHAQRAFAYHPEAEVISLGAPPSGDPDYGLLTLAPWEPLFERGLAFNQTLWRRLQVAASHFCMYDDASWSYSLLNAFEGLQRGRVEMVASAAPRVLSTREHASGQAGAAAARARLAGAALFPARVRTGFVATPSGRAARADSAPPAAGGWSDPRDQLLCLDPFLMTTHTTDNDTTPNKVYLPPYPWAT